MTGNGPLSKAPAGNFNFEPPPPGRTIYLEHTPKRIRVEVGGEVIADSRHAFILHESGLQPMYYFPPEDVRTDVMTPTDRHTHCPKKGDASYYTIAAGGETVENGAWYYPDPLPDAPFIKDLVAFYFDRMGRWLEEGEEIVVHPRDPYHRVDVVSTDRHIRVLARGRGAGRDRPGAGAVRVKPAAALVHPARGRARRAPGLRHGHPLSIQGDRELLLGQARRWWRRTDLIWYYTAPLAEVGRIAELLCFFNEKVDIELDGELQERPESPWSRRVRSEAPAKAAAD